MDICFKNLSYIFCVTKITQFYFRDLDPKMEYGVDILGVTNRIAVFACSIMR